MAIHTYLIFTIVGLLVAALAVTVVLFWYRPDDSVKTTLVNREEEETETTEIEPEPKPESEPEPEPEQPETENKTELIETVETETEMIGMKRLTVFPAAHPENNDLYGDRMHASGMHAVVTQRSPGSIHLYENTNHSRTIDMRNVSDACITADGQWIAINGESILSVSWNVRTNHTRLALSPNGRLVAAYGRQGSSSLLIEVANGNILAEIQHSNFAWMTDQRFVAGTRVYGVDARRDLGVQELPEYEAYHAVDEAHMLGVAEGRLDLIRVGPTTEVIDTYPGTETGGYDTVYGLKGLSYNATSKTLVVTGARGVYVYVWNRSDRAFYAQGILKSDTPSFGHSLVMLDNRIAMVSAPKMCVVTLCSLSLEDE